MLDKHFFIHTDSKTNTNDIITFKDYRISLLKDRLIRIERSKDNHFLDIPTSAILYRNFDEVEKEIKVFDTGIEIKTNSVTFYIDEDFEKSYVLIEDKKVKLDNKENLLSTFEGLDGCDGNVNDHYANPPRPLVLEKGVCSKNGVALIDDSKSMILNGKGLFEKQERFDVYVFAYGHEYQEAVKDFYLISGNVPLLPRFALGNWWSRYYAYKDQEYLDLMDKFIEKDIPLTVATIDMDWHPATNLVEYYNIDKLDRLKKEFGFPIDDPKWKWGWTGYTWSDLHFKNPKSFLKKLHKKGLKVTLNQHPGTICWYEKQYNDLATHLGMDPKQLAPINPNFFEENFVKYYFKDLHNNMEDEGVDFWWIDDVTYTFALAHYYYLDNGRNHQPLILCRYGGYGSHRYPIGFSGDSVISWKSLDYLPYFTANSSNIGYTWWSHDFGAFMAGVKDDELYLRYVQFGVFSPILRLHSQCNETLTKEPWAYKNGIGELAIQQLRLRHQMIPYLYSGTYRNSKDGLALIEPLYYYYPEDERAYEYKNEYMFNGQLLVAPITKHSTYKHMTSIKVFLPEGTWTDIFTNDKYEGNKVVTMVRPLDYIPVLAKEGGIFILSKDKKGNSIENPAHLEVNDYNGNGSFTLYEDNELKDESFTFFETYNEDNIQHLSIMFNDNGAIRKNRKLTINFKNITKGDVYCNENVKVKQKEFLTVTIDKIDTTKIYEIQVSYKDISKLDILKRQAKDSITFFEGKNEERVELFNKISEAKTISEFINIVNKSNLSKIYKQRLKECR